MMNTFQDVRDRYNSIRPVLSNLHSEEQDIRPLDKRSRKWERIQKVSNKCYALVGGYVDDGVSYWAWSDRGDVPIPDITTVAPIVWRPNQITIRNGPSGRISWHRFLREYLPYEFTFTVEQSGEHYISVLGDDARYYLPPNNNVYRTKKLVFKWVDSKWQVHGKTYEPAKFRYRIDKVAKAKYADAISDVREWVRLMEPVLGSVGWIAMREARLAAFPDGRSPGDGNPVREALLQPENPEMRMCILHEFMYDTRPSGEKSFSRRFNEWINYSAGFRTKQGEQE